ncbi:MAG: 3-deoxy-8-phosphooctulonate synthase [Deltaproteobacteria bacterium]|nr:3-deoxy-8-phosphooctulonate synthase [Candidatus Zymogenaceae bacterium]
MTRTISIGDIVIGGGNPLVLIAGPCVIEGEQMAQQTAHDLKEITDRLGIPFIYKSSYDKANRTSIDSPRGPGLDEGLKILERVKLSIGVPVTSDVHTPQEVSAAAQVLDVLQVPAFLCRQTDLLVACGETGKPVNVKKGQFLSPRDVSAIVKKVETTGNKDVMITERGTTFGYQNLVVDFRAFPIMRSHLAGDNNKSPLPPHEHPAVIFDATHSVQLPGAGGGITGGERQFIPYLTRAAVSVGTDGLFMEVHPDPPKALCDAANQWRQSDLESILRKVLALDALVKEWERETEPTRSGQ